MSKQRLGDVALGAVAQAAVVHELGWDFNELGGPGCERETELLVLAASLGDPRLLISTTLDTPRLDNGDILEAGRVHRQALRGGGYEADRPADHPPFNNINYYCEGDDNGDEEDSLWAGSSGAFSR